MKKIIIILITVVLSLSLFAQDRTVTQEMKPSPNYTLLEYDGVANDTVSNNRDSLAVDLFLNKPYPVGYYIYLDIDTVSSSSTTIKLQGRVFDEESWTDISSVSFGGTADTTFVFSFQNESNQSVTFATYTDTLSLIQKIDTLNADLTQLAYVDTSTTDTIVTRWTYKSIAADYLLEHPASTSTVTVTSNVKFYRYLRVLLIESGTGKTELQKAYFKIWRREN
jgi:hypothetical protein